MNMPNDKQDDASRLARALAVANALLADARSLHIASVDNGGVPLASYAPFVRDADGAFCVAVSGLAAHGRVLAGSSRVSVMLIEDEQAARQIFARTRLVFDCRVTAQTGTQRAEVFAALRARFGEVAQVLEGLGDFVAYRLVPENGNFVMGFGAAFDVPGGHVDAMRPVEIERKP